MEMLVIAHVVRINVDIAVVVEIELIGVVIALILIITAQNVINI